MEFQKLIRMGKKKIMLLGCSHAELPFVYLLKEMGYYVATVGNDENGLSHKFSDEKVLIDFSDYLSCENYFITNNFNLIFPGCNDFCLFTAVYINDKYQCINLDNKETTGKIHYKNEFRKICSNLQLHAPKAQEFNEVVKAINYCKDKIYNKTDLIIKPVDLTGGKGIEKINDISKVEGIIEKAFELSRQKKVVIEEFLTGTNHGFTSFIVNHKIVWYYCDEEYNYLDPYSVSGTSFPIEIKKNCLKILINDLEILSNELQLKDGLLHVQFKLVDDIPYLIEIMRRPPGDLYPYFVESAGYDFYTKTIIDGFLGNAINTNFFQTNNYYARHCIKGYKEGKIKNVHFNNELSKHMIKNQNLWFDGMFLKNYLTQKLAIIFLKFENKDQADTFNNNLYKFVQIEYY